MQGRLLKALEEGCGLVRLRFSAPKVPFPAWLEQHDRFSAELGLAEKALVKFSMDKEKWSYTMPGSVSPLQGEPRSTFVCNMDTDLEKHEEALKEAKKCEVPGVSEEYLVDSAEKGELEEMTPYLLWGEARRRHRAMEETVTSRFVEK